MAWTGGKDGRGARGGVLGATLMDVDEVSLIAFMKDRIRSRVRAGAPIGMPRDGRPGYLARGSFREMRWNSLAESENMAWYRGDADTLLAWYTMYRATMGGGEPIRSRNKQNMFYARSSDGAEALRRVHSDIPRTMVDTMSSVVGAPKVSCPSSPVLEKAVEESGLAEETMYRATPLTLVQGHGAWRVVAQAGKPAKAQFFDGLSSANVFSIDDGYMGSVFLMPGKPGELLVEVRRVDDRGVSVIETFRFIANSGAVSMARYGDFAGNDAGAFPSMTGYKPDGTRPEVQEFPTLNVPLSVPTKFGDDPLDPDGGASCYEGKLSVFDDIDQTLTIRSETLTKSVPVEYIDPEVLDYDADGRPIVPSVFDRQFIVVGKGVRGNGDNLVASDPVHISQPNLQFEQFTYVYEDLLKAACIGFISPSTLGIDLTKRGNAEAQREKEKVTIMTRRRIIERQSKEIALLSALVCFASAVSGGARKPKLPSLDKFSVNYEEFALPTFESMSKDLTPMLSAGAISPEMFVERLYGDRMTEEEKALEAKRIRELQEGDGGFSLPPGGLGQIENETELMPDGSESQQEMSERSHSTDTERGKHSVEGDARAGRKS